MLTLQQHFGQPHDHWQLRVRTKECERDGQVSSQSSWQRRQQRKHRCEQAIQS